MKRPMQARFGFGGYPWDGTWWSKAIWIALSRLIGLSAFVIGNTRAADLDVWRVEGL